MRKLRYLLDVNVAIALTEEAHVHHNRAMRWLETPFIDWGMCTFSEAGFLRMTANPRVGKLTMEQATEVLTALTLHAGYRFWPMLTGWSSLDQTLRERVFGHQQITEAYLLGLAIKGEGVLVTFDKGVRFLAGAKHARHVLVLE